MNQSTCAELKKAIRFFPETFQGNVVQRFLALFVGHWREHHDSEPNLGLEPNLHGCWLYPDSGIRGRLVIVIVAGVFFKKGEFTDDA